ncbi:MAG: AmmeMemoRadiSam system protein [Bacteroidetes bacterium]|nr:AmmeMemoRadiSam system protein [Bacteroidota bacterium]
MIKIRPLADTVGFAHTKLQMDSVVTRINRIQGNDLKASRLNAGIDKNTSFKTVISPHDDYTYTGYLYSLALENIKAKTVIIFGVAHKAKVFKVEDKLVFDSYSHWRSPYGNIPVSALRSDIIAKLPPGSFLINDSLQKAEHSVEAEIPFLHYYNKNVEIISILIPAMNYEKMNTLCVALAKSIAQVMKIKNLKWGADLAFVISNDAVHYGNEGWGGKDLALYGVDSSGYIKAVEHEYDILNSCMKGTADTSKIRLFTEFTLQKENYKEYKWAWCGRYSVPAGMLTSVYLARELKLPPVKGIILGYGTSIGNKHIKVDDLQGLGVTAVANLRHWVGYAAIGFK